jgi:hypothetical protein
MFRVIWKNKYGAVHSVSEIPAHCGRKCCSWCGTKAAALQAGEAPGNLIATHPATSGTAVEAAVAGIALCSTQTLAPAFDRTRDVVDVQSRDVSTVVLEYANNGPRPTATHR